MMALATMTVACGPEVGDLALPEDWNLVDPADDPWPGTDPDGLPCSRRALTEEAGTVELDTTVCGWITATAPSRVSVREGQPVAVFAFHAALTSEAPAEAVLGVRTPSNPLWTLIRPVPSSDAFYEEVIEAPHRIRAGDPLYLHVHNHGANTYRLGHLRAE